MVAGVSIITAAAVAASFAATPNVILYAAVAVGGIFAWKSKRGDFYKAVAEEKTAENQQLRSERDRLKELTDITPIVDKLGEVTAALERHTKLTDQVFAKVADMNGSLRAHTVAMEALADRLVLDEAARGLLAEASKDKPRERRERRIP